MYENICSLQENCFNCICDNLEALCEEQVLPSENSKTLVFSNDFFLPSNLSDNLLSNLCSKGKLDDEILSLFNSNSFALKRVKLLDIPNTISQRGLRVLKQHKLVELEVTGLRSATVNDLIGCLGEWTLRNLRKLNVANSTFLNGSKFCVVVSLSKLKNLNTLNVSNTEFNRHGLEIITEDLPLLENLDISCTPISDLSPLRKCRDQLKSLSMYNLRASHTDDVVSVICTLKNLQHLDVSDDFSVQPFVNLQPVKFSARDLLLKMDCLPHLISLDISGKEGIEEPLISHFLSTHEHIKYLGLALTDACSFPYFVDKEENQQEFRGDILVTGEASERQILESLRRYPNRPIYVQKSLFHLFTISQHYEEPRPDIIKLILPGMKCHPKELGVQMAATACLYNLTRGSLGKNMHPRVLAALVNLTLDAMSNFPNHQQLQKNALLTMCSDRILLDVNFDRFQCATLVMECLCSFEDSSMNRMSVAICSILVAKIPTEQTTILGSKASYMRKLLEIVLTKKEQMLADVTMKFTLSALWNLTDESPSTCEMFLDEGGLELFLEVLRVYSNLGEERTQVETKVLGLLNNLAEVKHLRKHLMKDDVVETVKNCLCSSAIDVSYFAAGIVSHLMMDGGDSWEAESVTREEMLQFLRQAVLDWEQPEGEMVAYRSFCPFFPLLRQYDAPQVQLWAVWAIQHVVLKNGSRYSPMLLEDEGFNILQTIIARPDVDQDVYQLATRVIELVSKQTQKSASSDGSEKIITDADSGIGGSP